APLSESPANALQKVGGFSDLSIPPHAAYALLHHLIAKIKHPPTPADQNGWRPGNRVGRIPIQMDHRLPEAEMIRQISVEDPGKPKPVGERAQPWRGHGLRPSFRIMAGSSGSMIPMTGGMASRRKATIAYHRRPHESMAAQGRRVAL